MMKELLMLMTNQYIMKRQNIVGSCIIICKTILKFNPKYKV